MIDVILGLVFGYALGMALGIGLLILLEPRDRKATKENEVSAERHIENMKSVINL